VNRWISGFLLAITLAPGCQRPDQDRTLVLYCGAGLRPPVEELVEQFEQQRGITVECDFAGSEVLLGRLKLTRAGDVYLPGDAHYVELARAEGLIEASKPVCYFVPVILVAKGNPQNIRNLTDLVRGDIQIGLGDPEACAIGRVAAKIFAKNAISAEAVEESVTFRSLTVNELGDKVKLGALDAVIVWDATAAYYRDATDVVQIPADQNVISTVPVAALKTSKAPELARQLMDFGASEEGKAVFAKHHYTVEKPD
jgi:molybdate transport system substrate-binding protein